MEQYSSQSESLQNYLKELYKTESKHLLFFPFVIGKDAPRISPSEKNSLSLLNHLLNKPVK
jgi:hypothetical protein